MADRRVTYQLSILAGKSPEVLRSVAAEAQAAAAAITALTEAQKRAAGSLAGTGRASVQGAISGTSASAVIGAGSAARDPAQVAARQAERQALAEQRAAEKAAAAEQKAEAKALAKAKADAAREAGRAQRAEDAAVAKAEREYERQRQASVRQSMGAIQGNAELEKQKVRELIAELDRLGKLDDNRRLTLEERLTAIQVDAESRSASLLARGVDPSQAFGPRGTRETSIGSGVLSTFFDQLMGRQGGGEGGVTQYRNVTEALSEVGEGLGDAAGKADTALKTLAGALGVVSPEAEAATTALGDIIGSLEVLLTPAGAVVGSAAAVAAGLAAVGAASIASVMHIAEMADELRELAKLSGVELVPEESIAGAEHAADALGDVSLAGTALAGVIAGAAAPALEGLARDLLAVGLLGAETFQTMLDGAGAFTDFAVDSFGGAVGYALTWPFELAVKAVEKYLSALNAIMSAVDAPDAIRAPFVAAQNAAMDLSDSIEALRWQAGDAVANGVRGVAEDVGTGYRLLAGEVEGLDAAYAKADALLEGRRQQRAAEAAGDAGGGAGGSAATQAAVAEVSDAAEVQGRALESLRDQLEQLRDDTRAPLDEVALRYARLRMELYGVSQAAGEAGAALSAQLRTELDAAEQRDRYAAIGESLALTNRELAASDARAQAAVAQRAGRAGEVVGALGAASQQLQQGNVVGALASAGTAAAPVLAKIGLEGVAGAIPQVAIVGEALGLLATLGELGAEEIRTRGEAFAAAVSEGLKVLPALIIDVAPDLALALGAGVADALLDLPDLIADAIYEAVTGRESENRGGGRRASEVAIAASETGDPLTVALVAGVRALQERAGGGSRSRSAAEADLASGATGPTGAARRDNRAVSVAISVRGNGVGMQRAIDVDTGPYGRLSGSR